MKKAFIVILVIALSAGICNPAAAAFEQRYITGMGDDILSGGAYIDGRRWGHLSGARELDELFHTRPDTELFMAFGARDFDWSGTGPRPDITMDVIRRHNITVTCETHNENGVRILASVRIEEHNGLAGVMFRFADNVSSLEDVTFSLSGSVTVRSGGGGSANFTLGGTFRNRSVVVTRFSNAVTLGPGRVGVLSGGFIPPANVRYDIGAGVTLTATLDRFATRIYGVARDLPTPQNIKNSWPAVEKMITVETIEIANGRVLISLDDTYYVYGPDMRYLGISNDSLPQMGRYYLSRTRL
ncbi:MAG: hypothetical protein FWH00_01685 [Oscillospiraceae bacterium]|nr:hypothetical protein [Oscillospiraceae bacterium]